MLKILMDHCCIKNQQLMDVFYKKRSTVRLKKYSCRYCQDSIRANFSGYPLPKGLQAARPNPEVMRAFFFFCLFIIQISIFQLTFIFISFFFFFHFSQLSPPITILISITVITTTNPSKLGPFPKWRNL